LDHNYAGFKPATDVGAGSTFEHNVLHTHSSGPYTPPMPVYASITFAPTDAAIFGTWREREDGVGDERGEMGRVHAVMSEWRCRRGAYHRDQDVVDGCLGHAVDPIHPERHGHHNVNLRQLWVGGEERENKREREKERERERERGGGQQKVQIQAATQGKGKKKRDGKGEQAGHCTPPGEMDRRF
jgi:hypothetical protein